MTVIPKLNNTLNVFGRNGAKKIVWYSRKSQKASLTRCFNSVPLAIKCPTNAQLALCSVFEEFQFGAKLDF